MTRILALSVPIVVNGRPSARRQPFWEVPAELSDAQLHDLAAALTQAVKSDGDYSKVWMRGPDDSGMSHAPQGYTAVANMEIVNVDALTGAEKLLILRGMSGFNQRWIAVNDDQEWGYRPTDLLGRVAWLCREEAEAFYLVMEPEPELVGAYRSNTRAGAVTSPGPLINPAVTAPPPPAVQLSPVDVGAADAHPVKAVFIKYMAPTAREVLAGAVSPDDPAAAEYAAATLRLRSPTQKAKKEEKKKELGDKAWNLLAENPNMKSRELAKALGCALGSIPALAAWRHFQQSKKHQGQRRAHAVSLTPNRERNLTGREEAVEATLIREEELEATIKSQKNDFEPSPLHIHGVNKYRRS
ncbi:MAG TPA: hypothetical protein VH253_17035 [Phycisphaerae bacterium]|nr:hypothetical protein [Phycisphaerae bacterium]